MPSMNPVASIWPYKVELPLEVSMRADVTAHIKLSSNLGLCRRHEHVHKDGAKDRAFCFTSRKHAEEFIRRFGGRLIEKSLEGPR